MTEANGMERVEYNERMVRVVAHYLLHQKNPQYEEVDLPFAKAVAFVSWELLPPLFPRRIDRDAALRSLGGLSCNEDHADQTIRSGGPLWLSEEHETLDWEDTGRMLINGIALTPAGLGRLVVDKVIPAEFAPAIGFDPDEAKRVRRSAKFKRWLADVWVDPTVGEPFYRRRKEIGEGGTRGVQKTSQLVRHLAYTKLHADIEKAAIDSIPTMSKRSKAAYKAHITRRITA